MSLFLPINPEEIRWSCLHVHHTIQTHPHKWRQKFCGFHWAPVVLLCHINSCLEANEEERSGLNCLWTSLPLFRAFSSSWSINPKNYDRLARFFGSRARGYTMWSPGIPLSMRSTRLCLIHAPADRRSMASTNYPELWWTHGFIPLSLVTKFRNDWSYRVRGQ